MVDSFISCFCGRSSGDNPPPMFLQQSGSPSAKWTNHAHNILNSLPLAARQGKTKRKDGVHSPVPESSLSNWPLPEERPIPRLPMDSNGTFWSVPWSSLRSEAFGVEKFSAVRREAVRARADAEAGADGERGRLQVAAQTSIHFFVNSESELVFCFLIDSEKFASGCLGSRYIHLMILFASREKVSAGLDSRLDAQQELLDLVLQNLRFSFNQILDFFQVVSCWHICIHRRRLSDQVCWLNL